MVYYNVWNNFCESEGVGLRLYLVVGENNFPLGDKLICWGILGLFKDVNKAWCCPKQNFDTSRVIEIDTDFDIEDVEVISNRKIRMLRIPEADNGTIQKNS